MKAAVLVDQAGDRHGQHRQQRRRRDQQQVDLADAVAQRAPHARRIAGAAMRLSVGNSTVATATLKMPWGSM